MGKEAILFKGQGSGIGNWVAFVDEISEGFASSLDLVEYLVKVQCRGQHRKNHQWKGSGCLHPTWDQPAETGNLRPENKCT